LNRGAAARTGPVFPRTLAAKARPCYNNAMKIRLFRIKNRRGYAAICDSHLTEGETPAVARARMAKALKRKKKRI